MPSNLTRLNLCDIYDETSEYEDDLEYIRVAFATEGFEVTVYDAFLAWRRLSADMGETWLDPQSLSSEKVVALLVDFFEEE